MSRYPMTCPNCGELVTRAGGLTSHLATFDCWAGCEKPSGQRKGQTIMKILNLTQHLATPDQIAAATGQQGTARQTEREMTMTTLNDKLTAAGWPTTRTTSGDTLYVAWRVPQVDGGIRLLCAQTAREARRMRETIRLDSAMADHVGAIPVDRRR